MGVLTREAKAALLQMGTHTHTPEERRKPLSRGVQALGLPTITRLCEQRREWHAHVQLILGQHLREEANPSQVTLFGSITVATLSGVWNL